jgi:ADP-heptose:LPS heptosyltransferase
MFLIDQCGQFESFAMTAAAIKALDLILTVDTSVAHLAGALGKEVWLLLSTDSDFRWGSAENQIWYPTMRVFKQRKFRDWQSVIERVMAELSQLGFDH